MHRASRPRSVIVRGLAVAAPVLALVSCALVAGLNSFERLECQADCGATDAGAPQSERDVEAASPLEDADTSSADVAPPPLLCGGGACDDAATCCAAKDAEAARCVKTCPADDVLIACDDDRQCAAIEARCCGVFSGGEIAFLRCQRTCTEPLCDLDAATSTCRQGTRCQRPAPGAPAVCSPQ